MLSIIFIVISILVICFGFVLLYGAPYVPTLKKQVEDALDLAEVKPGECLVELGSGDGRVLIAAAKRGCSCIGYELNPIMFVISLIKTRKYRHQIRVRCKNFWKTELPITDIVFVFLLDSYMHKLDNKVVQETKKDLRLISFAFKIPNRKISKEIGGLYRYEYSKAIGKDKKG